MSEELKIPILYIDDELNNLNSFKANFRHEFEVFTAHNTTEALEIMDANEIYVVISDQRMPKETGVEFFERLVETNPDPVRILLTGYSDITAVIDAVNKGQIYRYVEKPWDFETLRLAIMRGAELYSTRNELKEKNASLEKALDEIDLFIYSISHDLRAPITSILSVLNLVEMEIEKDDASQEYFRMIREMTEKLEGFSRQLVNYYKITHNDLNSTEIEWEKFIKKIVGMSGGNCDIADNIVHVDLNTHGEFYGHPIKLEIILSNLISNAIKYSCETDNARVDVEIKGQKEGATIKISDNGIGIQENKIQDVFNMFYRATQKSTGSGMGLYIVKEAVTRMGGDINLSSKEGQGTEITLFIPNSPSV